MTTKTKGLLYAIGAYLCWALLSLFWKQLSAISSYDVFAYRICWTFVTMTLYAGIFQKKAKFKTEILALKKDTKSFIGTLFASLFIATNWLVYIYAVTNQQATEASLGYYVMPLVSIVLSVVFLKERLTVSSIVAVILASLGVLILIGVTGKMPLVTVILALSFGIYGLLKKQVGLSSDVAMLVESGFILPFALGYLIFFSQSSWMQHTLLEQILLMWSGVVTATPLLLFSEAIKRAPLNQVGFIQYLNPTLQLLIAIFVFGEGITGGELIGFTFIWLAVIVFILAQLFPRNKR